MIELYTAPTPNGWKVSIALEEMQLPYEVHPVDLRKGEQKTDDYRALNPNGRIPTIVDRENDNFAVFESGAILLYLAEKTGLFLPEHQNRRSEVIQWLMFQMGGVGPMMGQANVFYRYLDEKIPTAISRYQHEVRRLFEVLDRQLEGRDYLLDDYGIADIAHWSWVKTYRWSGVEIDGLTHLSNWIDRIAVRPAVVKGLEVPSPPIKSEELIKSAKTMITR